MLINAEESEILNLIEAASIEQQKEDAFRNV